MKGQSEHTITAWLRRWLRGDARAADEQRLDEAAAGDDFLREALEGLRRHPEVDHAAATDRLRRRLRARTRRRGGIVMLLPRIAAAASVALLLGLAWWWWRPVQSPAELAATEQTQPEITPENPPPAPDSSLAALTERPVIDQPQAAAKGETRAVAKKTMPAPKPVETEEADSQPEAATIAAVPAPPEQTTKPAIALNDSVEPVAAPTAPRATPLAGARRNSGPRLLHGQVLTPEGEPLIGANVILKGTATGVVTDIDGRFTLTLTELQPSILINYLGYANREVAIHPGDDSLRIVLAETPAAADEVVVIGLGQAKRPAAGIARENKAIPTNPTPQPVGGFKELDKYVRKNLVYPDAARRQSIAGTVRLEFRVQPDGTLADFRVLDSLGYGCDAEAIRLLREGPKWQTPAGQTVPATYAVRFELPRK